ncbi:MAG: hypothetical protein GY719_19840 [bacterium]|nr:hypothetical protein [bacterium]
MTSTRTTFTVLISIVSLQVAAAGAALAGSPAANPDYQGFFPSQLAGERVRSSSIALADVDGNGDADIVVGGSDGIVHVYDGDGTELWTYDTGSMSIESKPAVADIDDDGSMEVVVTAGSNFTPDSDGGLYVLDHQGNLQCEFLPLDSGDADLFLEGILSSPAVADLDGDDGGKLEIAFGAWDRFVRVIHHDCTLLWENFVIDTVWSSPAIGDIDRDGQLDVVIGVDSDDDPGPNGEEEGGILHVYDGADGSELAGFPIQIDEVLWSSPGLADLTGDGWLEIVVGTGRCWASAACAPSGTPNPNVGEYLNAWDHTGQYLPGWPVAVPDTYAFASPALADIDNDGLPEVIINTINPDDINDGQVYALNADGSSVPGWPTRPTLPASPTTFINFSTSASPVIADVTGDGDLEVILPSNWDLVVFDKDGNQLSRDTFPTQAGDFELRTNQPVSASAAVGDIDGDGDLEVVVGGVWETPPDNTGAIYSWDFPAADSSRQPWPMFRRGSDNRAVVEPGIFTDGFETGDFAAWSSQVP